MYVKSSDLREQRGAKRKLDDKNGKLQARQILQMHKESITVC